MKKNALNWPVLFLIVMSTGCFDVFSESEKKITKNFYISHWTGADGFLVSRRTTGSNYQLIVPPFVFEVIYNDSMIMGKKIDSLTGTDTLYFKINIEKFKIEKPVDTIGFSDYYYFYANYNMKLIFTNGRL
jgi:hypothetical protein